MNLSKAIAIQRKMTRLGILEFMFPSYFVATIVSIFAWTREHMRGDKFLAMAILIIIRDCCTDNHMHRLQTMAGKGQHTKS